MSAGQDYNILIWNTQTGEKLIDLSGMHSDQINSISWNHNGSAVATTCKDKKIRVIDPRKKEVVSQV